MSQPTVAAAAAVGMAPQRQCVCCFRQSAPRSTAAIDCWGGTCWRRNAGTAKLWVRSFRSARLRTRVRFLVVVLPACYTPGRIPCAYAQPAPMAWPCWGVSSLPCKSATQSRRSTSSRSCFPCARVETMQRLAPARGRSHLARAQPGARAMHAGIRHSVGPCMFIASCSRLNEARELRRAQSLRAVQRLHLFDAHDAALTWPHAAHR